MSKSSRNKHLPRDIVHDARARKHMNRRQYISLEEFNGMGNNNRSIDIAKIMLLGRSNF